MKYFLEYRKDVGRHTYILRKDDNFSYEDNKRKYVQLSTPLVESMGLTNEMNEFIAKKAYEGSQCFNQDGSKTNLFDSIISEYKSTVEFAKRRVLELKKLLSSSDYKVVKNHELMAAGLPPEYNPGELHSQRQAWRDEINSLEERL